MNRTKSYAGIVDRAWIEIDLNNLKHNVRMLKQAMPKNCELMAVVKAEAYGHGAFEVATFINRIGVRAFAVATIDEGIALRGYGIQGEILILGYTNPMRVREIRKYNLSQTIIDYDYAKCLNRQGCNIKVHIKVDTGMHRLGLDFDDEVSVLEIFKAKYFRVCGIFTHLCVADSLLADDVDFTKKQIQRFYELLAILKEKGIKLPKIHIQSSYGFLNYPELKCDYVRAGISLYGVLSSPNDRTRLQLDLQPVMSLKSQVVHIKHIEKGSSIGYGRAFIANRDSIIATISIGYADGLPRNLSCGNGEVLVRGRYATIIGRISMDQLAIDVTDIPDLAVGDIVTLIGKDGKEELHASQVACNSETITNEWISRLGARLRIIKK